MITRKKKLNSQKIFLKYWMKFSEAFKIYHLFRYNLVHNIVKIERFTLSYYSSLENDKQLKYINHVIQYRYLYLKFKLIYS